MIYDLALRLWTSRIDDARGPSRPRSPSHQTAGDFWSPARTTSRQWDATTGEVVKPSLVPGLRDLTRMTYTEDGLWLVISHPRSLTVLDAQTLRVAVADLPLDTEAPTDAFAVAAGQDHQLLVGTTSSARLDRDGPGAVEVSRLPGSRTPTHQG